MKNFSLKALGAFIFAAGLVVAGVSAPAVAIGPSSMAVSSTVDTFSAGQSTGSFTVTGTQTVVSQNMDNIDIYIKNSTPEGWAFKNTCPSTYNSDLSLCGVTSVSFAANGTNFSDVTTGAQVKSFTYAPNSVYRIYIKLASPAAGVAGSKYRVQYNNAFTVGTVGSYTMTFSLGLSTGGTPDSGSMTFTSSASLYTVTFDANGGTGSLSSQSASGSNNLTSNNGSISRSGYTFNGWNTQANGSGTSYADGVSYPFTSSETLYAQWTSNGGGGSSASASLSLNAATGQLVAGSSVAVSASGLQATAPYTITVQSTPQTIGSGNAVSGAVSTNVTLPSGLEAGWHTLTFTSTAADGSAVESKYYFKISASGTLLSTSSTLPAELANTGINAGTGISLLAGGLSLALVGAELFMIARRKRSN